MLKETEVLIKSNPFLIGRFFWENHILCHSLVVTSLESFSKEGEKSFKSMCSSAPRIELDIRR